MSDNSAAITHTPSEQAHNGEHSNNSAVELRPNTLVQVNFDAAVLNANEVENLEFVTPTGINLMLLQAPECNMHGSMHSTTSTNNTDICILEAHESHYDMEPHNGSQQFDNSGSTIDTQDFTVLHAPIPSPAPPATDTPPQHQSISCTCDESTEVLLLHSAECNGRSTTAGGHAFSGTDSDVEVLMSEEIIDSDWSAGAGTLDELVHTPDEQLLPENIALAAQMISAQNNNNIKSSSSASVKQQESTDQDISVEEFSHSSISACEQLPRAQLLSVIREQATHIRHLEATVQRYRRAQRALFEHVEALRLALESDPESEVGAATTPKTEFVQSHETIN